MAGTIIHYAIEIDTESTITDASIGSSYGFLRYITELPAFTTALVVDTSDTRMGDNSDFLVNITNTESINTAFQSGQLYKASTINGFKTVNTVPDIGMRFTVYDTDDFTGSELATAKGSAPANTDMFYIDNNASGSEAITYIGQNKWYDGFITRDGLSNPSRRVDLLGTGGYGTLSGFNFQIENTMVAGISDPYWKKISDNGINLINKKITLYCVINNSADTNGCYIYYTIWAGIIDSIQYTDTDFKYICKSDFKKIHKDFPPNTFNGFDYPNCVDDVKDESVPVCLGDVEYAQIFNVSGEPQYQTLCLDLTNRPYIVACADAYTEGASSATIRLVTAYIYGSVYEIAADELIGKYLFVLSGGGSPDTDRGIRIIDNDATTSVNPMKTSLTLAEPVPYFDLSKYGWFGSEAIKDRWQFAIADINTTGIVSNANIKEYITNSNNKYQAFYYDGDEKKYKNINHSINEISTEDANYNNTATISLLASNIEKTGDVKYIFPIETVYLSKFGTPTTDDPLKMFDNDRSTSCVFSKTVGPYSEYVEIHVNFDVELNETELNFEEMYCVIDVKNNYTSDVETSFSLSGYDEYDREIQLMNTGLFTITASSDYNIIPNEYYRNNGNDNGESSVFAGKIGSDLIKDIFAIDSDFFDGIKNNIYRKKLKALLLCRPLTNPSSGSIEIKQIAICGVTAADVTSSNIYTRVSGEYLDDDSTTTDSVYTAFRRVLEDYDGINTLNINYDNLATTRTKTLWHVGTQITNRDNSFNHLKELAESSFVQIYSDRKGRIKLSAWREKTDTAHTHNASTIVNDSIDNWKYTPLDKIYNNFQIYFSKNPAEDKYFSQYVIADVGTAGAGTDCQWPELWNVCNAAYTKYGVVRQLSKNLDYFIDTGRIFDSPSYGSGSSSAAYQFLYNCVFWLTRQKRDVNYNIGLSVANLAVDLCDPVEFTDAIYTNGDAVSGNIYYIEYDIPNNQIKIGSILEPDDTIDDDYGDIIETGNASDTITESGSQSDTITEDGV